LFLNGSNFLVDGIGEPKGSKFSDLVVKFDVGGKTYEGTILTNLSRKLANNQFQVAVRVPDTLALGDSRIVQGRKQNEKVSQNPAEPAKEVLKNSNSYRVENTTDYAFAAQWTADRIAVLNAPRMVTRSPSQSLSAGVGDRRGQSTDLRFEI
jgi:hypothetical protein